MLWFVQYVSCGQFNFPKINTRKTCNKRFSMVFASYCWQVWIDQKHQRCDSIFKFITRYLFQFHSEKSMLGCHEALACSVNTYSVYWINFQFTAEPEKHHVNWELTQHVPLFRTHTSWFTLCYLTRSSNKTGRRLVICQLAKRNKGCLFIFWKHLEFPLFLSNTNLQVILNNICKEKIIQVWATSSDMLLRQQDFSYIPCLMIPRGCHFSAISGNSRSFH